MRIIIDTEREAIVVANSFFTNIDKQNKVLADNGVDKKVDYVEFIKKEFNKAINKPLLRQSDIKKK